MPAIMITASARELSNGCMPHSMLAWLYPVRDRHRRRWPMWGREAVGDGRYRARVPLAMADIGPGYNPHRRGTNELGHALDEEDDSQRVVHSLQRLVHYLCVNMCTDIRTDVCTDTCTGMRTDIRVDGCTEICTDMCTHMCTDMPRDMCTHMPTDMCTDMRTQTRVHTCAQT